MRSVFVNKKRRAPSSDAPHGTQMASHGPDLFGNSVTIISVETKSLPNDSPLPGEPIKQCADAPSTGVHDMTPVIARMAFVG